MTEQSLIQDILIKEFRAAKAKNPSFSQRAFARRLGLSSGAISSIISGKRNVSKEMAQKLLENLGASPKERDHVLAKFKTPRGKPILKRTIKERQLSMDQFELIADGIHFSLLSLMETKDFTSCPEFISKRLGKSKREVKSALKRLMRLELIQQNEQGDYSCLPIELSTPDEVISSSLKQSHIESMEDAKESLFRDSIDKRDFTSQTISINSKKLEQAKELIRRFGDEFAELMSTQEKDNQSKDEVYKINIQFFPHDQRDLMKKLVFTLLVTFSAFATGLNLNHLKISLEEAKILLGKNLPDEIILKERIKLEDAEAQAGEIMGHKVGNGFGIFGPNPTIKPLINCQVLGTENLNFNILKSSEKKLVAVFTENPEKENIAEFLQVNYVNRSAGLRSYSFYTGSNPLRGEMFQLEYLRGSFQVLRIVTGEKLYHFKVQCKDQ